jgi:hypothetical protein
MGILIICLIFTYRLKLKVKRLKMALTLDERVEIVLLSGREGWTQRQVADEFNARHPERNPITQSAVEKLVKKFKETGSCVDKPRVGRPSFCMRRHSNWSDCHISCQFPRVPEISDILYYLFYTAQVNNTVMIRARISMTCHIFFLGFIPIFKCNCVCF